MIITFCGHSNFVPTTGDDERMLALLEKVCQGEKVEFWLGGYGGFDNFAASCCRQFKKRHPNAHLVLVVPYLPTQGGRDMLFQAANEYDEIAYPGLEGIPKRYAISKRNMRMVEGADAVIYYVRQKRGGAVTTYQYAVRKKKTLYPFLAEE